MRAVDRFSPRFPHTIVEILEYRHLAGEVLLRYVADDGFETWTAVGLVIIE